MLRPDPAQQPRLLEIRDNLLARIAEADREGWIGEVEGLKVSLAGAEDKLAQMRALTAKHGKTLLGMPDVSTLVGRGTSDAPRPVRDDNACG